MQSPDEESPTSLANLLAAELLGRYSLPVSQAWIADFTSTIRAPPPPIQALASTAHFRILNTNFTQTLSLYPPNALLFPPNASDVNTKETRLLTHVPVQVLSIEDIGTSTWSQIEAIERVERGEEVRGREVIRTVPIMNEESDGGSGVGVSGAGGQTSNIRAQASTKRSDGPHKLLLEDAAGVKIYGFEMANVDKVSMTMTAEEGGMNIGCKLLLKEGCTIRRGMVMLRPEHVSVVGGKVEEWDQAWRMERKARMKRKIQTELQAEIDQD